LRLVSVGAARFVPAFTSVGQLAQSTRPGQEYAAVQAAAALDLVRSSGADGLLVDGGTAAAVAVPVAELLTYFSTRVAGMVSESVIPAGSALEVRPAPPLQPGLASQIRVLANSSPSVRRLYVFRVAPRGERPVLTIGAEFDEALAEAGRRKFLMQLGELAQASLTDFQIQDLAPDFAKSLSSTLSAVWTRPSR
jgi:hypothetical protein